MSVVNGKHVGENGSFDANTNTIRLDINAGIQGNDTILFTAAHELTHFIRLWSHEKFKVFADFLVESYAKHGIDIDTLVEQQIKKAKSNGREIDYDTAYEEVVADSCETFLRDSKLLDKLIDLAKKDMTLFEKTQLYIATLLDDIRKCYNDYEPDTPEARAILKWQDSIEKLHSLWEEAALSALDNSQKAGGRIQKNTTDEGDVFLSGRKVYKKRKTVYNELNSLAMKWAYSAGTKTGDVKVFSANGKHFVLLEATDNGYIEIAKGTFEEVKRLEEKYQESGDSFHVHTEMFRSYERGDTSNHSATKNSGEYEQSGRQNRGEGLQTNTARNNENLQSSHKGKQEIKFSDRNYSYNALINKPDMKLTVIGGKVPNNRADVVAQAKKNAAKVGKFNTKDGSISVHVDDIGLEILLGTDGLKHGLRRTKDAQNEPNYIVTLKAGEIIKNSIKINEIIPQKDTATGAYVLIGAARNTSGDLYIVRSVINQFNNELAEMDVLYAINTKKESAALNAPRFTAKPLSDTDSTISISNLLDYVNKYFPDILPEV